MVDIDTKVDTTRPCQVYANEEKLGVIQNDPRYNFDGGMSLKLANIPQTQLAHNYLTASATVDGNAVAMVNDDMDTTSTNTGTSLTGWNFNVYTDAACTKLFGTYAIFSGSSVTVSNVPTGTYYIKEVNSNPAGWIVDSS